MLFIIIHEKKSLKKEKKRSMFPLHTFLLYSVSKLKRNATDSSFLFQATLIRVAYDRVCCIVIGNERIETQARRPPVLAACRH